MPDEAARTGARRIFVDGVTAAINSTGGQELREAFHILVEGLQREQLTAVLAIEASTLDLNYSSSLPEEQLADTVLRLRMEENDRATTRSIEIVKSRGQNFQMGPTRSGLSTGAAWKCIGAYKHRGG